MTRLVKRFVLAGILVLVMRLPAAAQQDAFDIHQANIVNSPDVRNWPVTTAITNLSFGQGVTRVNFTKRDGPTRWPDVTPAGWSGPLEYTLWLFVQVNGQWTGAGFIQFWNGRDGTGDASTTVTESFSKNWYYAERWSPIFGHGLVRVGENIGFMVSSGNARDSVGPYGPQERSNVVVVQATDAGSYDFPAQQPAPTPAPGPAPAPPPTVIVVPGNPAPLPTDSTAFQFLLSRVDQCVAGIQAVKQSVDEGRTENRTFFEAVRSEWKTVVKYAAPIVGALVAGRQLK